MSGAEVAIYFFNSVALIAACVSLYFADRAAQLTGKRLWNIWRD